MKEWRPDGGHVASSLSQHRTIGVWVDGAITRWCDDDCTMTISHYRYGVIAPSRL